jgi:hypothetical protein
VTTNWPQSLTNPIPCTSQQEQIYKEQKTYYHNRSPANNNRRQEHSRAELANDNSHRWLEENIGHEKHQNDNGLATISISKRATI